MNGIDFDEDNNYLNFQFNGTGGAISTWVIIMGTIIFGFLIVSIIIFLMGLQDFLNSRKPEAMPRASYVVPGGNNMPQLRPSSRASSGALG